MVTFCFVWGLVRQYRGCFECPNAPPSRVACRMEPWVRQHFRAYLQISAVPVMAAGTCCVQTFQPRSQYSREQSGSNRRLRREDPFVPLPSLVPHFATFFLLSVLCTPPAPSSLARTRPSLLPSLLMGAEAVGNFRRIGPVSESSVSSGHSTPFCVMLFALQSARDTPLEMATCTGPCHKICGIKLTKEDPVAPCPSQLCASAPSDRASLPRPGSNAGSRWPKRQCHRVSQTLVAEDAAYRKAYGPAQHLGQQVAPALRLRSTSMIRLCSCAPIASSPAAFSSAPIPFICQVPGLDDFYFFSLFVTLFVFGF